MRSRETAVLYLLALAYLQNACPRKAATLLAALDSLDPDQPSTLLALAWAQIRSGEPADALSTLGRARSTSGAGAAYHLLRAQALGALRRPSEAYVAIRIFLRLRGAGPSEPPPRA